MQMLPKDLLGLMLPFAALFSKRVWQSVLVLVVGAILAPGKRTVSAILRVMGLEQDSHFQTYHRVLNRAMLSSRKASAILLKQLGVETQRQWSDKAIARTTPALFGLFSIVVLFAHELLPQEHWHLRQSAWSVKSRPCFIDALALVRSYWWAPRLFQRSGADTTLIKVPAELFTCWLEALCYAA